jgi:hypothetical protein
MQDRKRQLKLSNIEIKEPAVKKAIVKGAEEQEQDGGPDYERWEDYVQRELNMLEKEDSWDEVVQKFPEKDHSSLLDLYRKHKSRIYGTPPLANNSTHDPGLYGYGKGKGPESALGDAYCYQGTSAGQMYHPVKGSCVSVENESGAWVVVEVRGEPGSWRYDLKRQMPRQVEFQSLRRLAEGRAVPLGPCDEILRENQEALYFRDGICMVVDVERIHRSEKEYYFDVRLKMFDVGGGRIKPVNCVL